MGRCRRVSSQSPKAVGVGLGIRGPELYKPYYFLNLDMAGLELCWNIIPKDCLYNDSRELVSMVIPLTYFSKLMSELWVRGGYKKKLKKQ